MTKHSLRHHSAHPPSKVLANPNVNQKPNPARAEKATAPAPRVVPDKPGAEANPNFPANHTPLPPAQNNPSLGPIVSGRTKLDAVNSRLDEVDVGDPDSPDYDPDDPDADCEEEERQPNLKIS